MPEQEGIETMLFVRKNFLNLNVIAISGHGPGFLRVARKLDARAGLCKPFSARELVATVDSICPPAPLSGSGTPGVDEDWLWQG
jgi:DNA-binding response OmpR family regulator